MSWTSPSDIIDNWIDPNTQPTDNKKIQTQINKAEAIIKKHFPKIQQRIDAETLPLDLVKGIVSDMVIRVFQNAKNVTQISEAAGTFNHSLTYKNVGIYLTDEEMDLLEPILNDKVVSVSMMPSSLSTSNSIQYFNVEEMYNESDYEEF